MIGVEVEIAESSEESDRIFGSAVHDAPTGALELLRGLDFFAGLSEAILADVARSCHLVVAPAGHLVFRQGDASDSLYIVSAGRLDISVENGDLEPVSVAEAGRGQIFGEMGLLTGEPRSATVGSMRDSLLFRLPKESFEELIARHPALTRRIACDLSNRLKKSNQEISRTRHLPKTFAVIPAGAGGPVAWFTRELIRALSEIGATRHITAALVDECVGGGDMSDARLVHWLTEQEARFDFLIYEAEASLSSWTSRCIRQADRILAVAPFEGPRALNEVEARLARLAVEAPRTHPHVNLILLHSDSATEPSGTPEWLEGRAIERHHHLWTDRPQHFTRLARVLAGRAVGLVLGGGGARAFAHIGAIQALEEAGITIETIGGTSQGALVGAQYAQGLTPAQMVETNRKLFREFRPFKGDFTLPFYSFVTGKRTNKGLQQLFGKMFISDLRIPFSACRTTSRWPTSSSTRTIQSGKRCAAAWACQDCCRR